MGVKQRSSKPDATRAKKAVEHEDSPAATSLSKYVWSLKKQGKTPKLSWSKECLAPFFTSGSRKCMLCLKEKESLGIVKFPDIRIFVDHSRHVRIRKISVSGKKISGMVRCPLSLSGSNGIMGSACFAAALISIGK